jgi:2-polyprenyl-3-methyl-5-hydroxy-6-metoxy-1,4-benzoquinol methylase
MVMKNFILKIYNAFTHFYGRISEKYYCEDFIRVYPNGIRFNRLGWRSPLKPKHIKNFLNHQKFYTFACQFARGAVAADIGCGSGYGCALLKDAGAVRVCGSDASNSAIHFATEHYSNIVEFSVQSITDMYLYNNDQFGLTICSEVLEHIKEYEKEDQAVKEINRITQPNGIIIIATPNSELQGDHGFSFEEMEILMKKHFTQYCIFENALLPFGSSKKLWEQRLSEGRTGVIVSQAINLDEVDLPNGVKPELKSGKPAGIYRIGNTEVNTTLLHNTNSWVIVAIKDQI